MGSDPQSYLAHLDEMAERSLRKRIEELERELRIANHTRDLAQEASTKNLEALRKAEATTFEANILRDQEDTDRLLAAEAELKKKVEELSGVEQANRVATDLLKQMESRALYADQQAKDFKFDADRLRTAELLARKEKEELAKYVEEDREAILPFGVKDSEYVATAIRRCVNTVSELQKDNVRLATLLESKLKRNVSEWQQHPAFETFCELKYGIVGQVLSCLQDGQISSGRAAECLAEIAHGAKEVRLPNQFDDPEHLEARVMNWIISRIGQDSAGRKNRAMRLYEESVELLQAEGIDREKALRQLDYVYERPPGEPEKEIGGVAVCVLGYCAAISEKFVEAALREIERIEAKPVEEIRGSVARKQDRDLEVIPEQ